MAFDFFGFSIVKKEVPVEEKPSINNVVPPVDTEGSIISSGGYFGTHYNLEFSSTNENLLINKYREISLQPEVESAVDEIVNEAIAAIDDESPVDVNLDQVKYSDEIKDMIREEFENVLSLLNFRGNAYEIFKRWYVDGRIQYYIAIDTEHPEKGIQELSYMDPRKLKKIKEVIRKKNRRGVEIIDNVNEFYIYNDQQQLKIPNDSISSVTSGLVDDKNNIVVLSYLHKAIKPLNQLRMLEDSTVIYRLSRAPERRIFYVDVGNLPKVKAEQYLNEIMGKYRNKIVYDAETGEVRDDKKTLSMQDDFWIPRREGGKGTEITTLPSGQNLGELDDIKYFQRKLYRCLNVPVGRLEDNSTFNSGRATEINREEVKFFKFVQRLRNRFSVLFHDLLRKQLILKRIVTPEDWDSELDTKIFYDFKQDSHFLEYSEAEIMTKRIELAQAATQLGEEFFSNDYIKKNILKMSEVDMDQVESDKDLEAAEEEPEGEAAPDETTPEEEPSPEEQA
jgi:hypothetical protein